MTTLKHVGVKGMKWGVIKARYQSGERARNAKIDKAIARGGAKQTTDFYRFKYLKDPAHVRLGKTAVTVVRNRALKEVFTYVLSGKTSLKFPMSKTEVAKIAIDIGKKTATDFVIKDTLAKSALSRYTEGGKRKKGKWHGNKLGLSREDAAEVSIAAARHILPFVGVMAGKKLSEVSARGKANRERVEKWGANILPAKVEDLNVVWTSADGSTQVIDPSGRLQ